MVWTQGPILKFKEGDSLTSKDGKICVQVKFANQMGWDTEKGEMYKGAVIYDKTYSRMYLAFIQKQKITLLSNG